MVSWSISAQKVRIVDEANRPLENVKVWILPDSTIFVSNAEGLVTLPSFGSSFIFQLEGFEPISVSKNQITSPIILSDSPLRLNAVKVNERGIPNEYKRYPGAFSQINRRSIQANAPTLVTPILHERPGIYMHSGALNTNRITIRGIGSRSPFSTNKIRAYFDDIPLTTGSGETTLEDIDLSVIEQVEIIKGPNASLYGAGLGGSILLQPSLLETSQISSTTSVGSFGLFKQSINGGNVTKNSQTTINAGILTREGFRENNETDRQNIMLHHRQKFGKNTLTLLGLWLDQKAFIPSSLDQETYENEPSSAAFTWNAARGFEDYQKVISGLSWKHELNSRLSWKTSTFLTYRDANEPRPFNILEEETLGLGFRFKVTQQFPRWTVQAGTEFYRDHHEWNTFQNRYRDFPDQGSVKGDPIDLFDERRNNVNSFAQAVWTPTDKWTITTGLNVNQTQYELQDLNNDEVDQSGTYRFEWIFSPRIGINYQLGKHSAIYGAVGHGFSPPTLEETLTPDGMVNSDIQPEMGVNYEVGYRNANDKWSIDLTAFHMNIKDLLISRRTSEDQYFGINAGRTTHTGLELLSYLNLWSGNVMKVRQQANYTLAHYRFREFDDGDFNYDGNQLTGIPANHLQSHIDVTWWNQLFIRLRYEWVDEIPITDQNDIYSEAYHLWDIHVGYQKILNDQWDIRLTYMMRNIFDAHYASMLLINAVGFGNNDPRYYYPGLPRNHMLNLEVNYLFGR